MGKTKEELKNEIQADIDDCIQTMKNNAKAVVSKSRIVEIHKALAELDGMSRTLTNTFNDLYELESNTKKLVFLESELQANLTEAMNAIKHLKQEILGRCS